MKKFLLLIFLGFYFLPSYTQNVVSSCGSFTDKRDGKTYKTITIGNLCIMAENLAYIPASGKYWVYNRNPENIKKYGLLYDWETAQAVVPDGWHLPSQEEWETIYKAFGGDPKTAFTSITTGAYRTFNPVYAGYQCGKSFYYEGVYAEYWGSTYDYEAEEDLYPSQNAWGFGVDSKNKEALVESYAIDCGHSIRLIKD